MTILYLHGFCAKLNGKKASCLRSHFGQSAVVEPEEPGFPYCKSVTIPVLEKLGDRFRKDPISLLGLLGPNRIAELTKLSPELVLFFRRSVDAAQELYDRVNPRVIVGSSLGGSVAMAINSQNTPMVLIGPVWNRAVKSALAIENMPDLGVSARFLLSMATAALRHPIARFAGFEVPRSIKPRTIILHSAHDQIFDLANSRRLMRNSPIAPEDPSQVSMKRVADQLAETGYGNRQSNGKRNFNDGRLVVIGKDHHANDADPHDRHNKDPDPHNAMVTAVRLLLEEFASG